MKPTNLSSVPLRSTLEHEQRVGGSVHRAWLTFIRYCAELQHGEIETLKIQDGLPVLAEVVRRKIKFKP